MNFEITEEGYNRQDSSAMDLTKSRKTYKEVKMKTHEWAKPKAKAIPKEMDQLKQGKYGPIFEKSPACYGFSIIAKLIPGREPAVYEHARKIEKAVAETTGLSRRAQATLPALAAFQNQWRNLLSVSRHLRHGLRQIHRGCGSSLLGDRHRHGLRESRRFPQGLEDQSVSVRQVRPRPSLPELSWNTGSTLT